VTKYAYDNLTFLDNSFLILEQANTPMHIAGTPPSTQRRSRRTTAASTSTASAPTSNHASI